MFVRYFIIYKRFVLEEQAIFNEEFRGRLSVEIYAFFNYVSETGILYLFQSSLVLPIIMPLLK